MKVQLPWFGKATGSSAGMIYQSYWGHTYARTFPAIFHYPDTPAQQLCQDIYWGIRRSCGALYEEIRYDISPYQKRMQNPYNTLNQSARKLFLAGPPGLNKNWPMYFGVDSLNAISANIIDANNMIRPDRINFDSRLRDLSSKFIFEPTKVWYALVNFTRMELWCRQGQIERDYLYGFYPNTTGWPELDNVLFAACIANEHYMSNFFWCLQP